MADWLTRDAAGGLIVSLHIQPGAKRSEIAGLHGDALKIRVAAPPVEGRANEALIAFLADTLDVAKSQIAVVAGMSGRRKRVRVTGVAAEALERLAHV